MNQTSFARMKRYFCRLTPALCLSLMILFLAAATAFAHDPGLSAAELRFIGNDLEVHLTFARTDIESLHKADDVRELESVARRAVSVSADDRELTLDNVSVNFDDSNGVHFRLRFLRAVGNALTLRSLLIPEFAAGHRQFLVLRDADQQTLGTRLLEAQHNLYELNLTTVPRSQSVWTVIGQFLTLGTGHIWMGLDHLAFLLALLIASNTLRDALKIITSFTVAHSITLSLAALKLISLPANIVEPMIAVSIIYAGLENLLRREPQFRWLLTFGFGLIHGFGFASALHESGISSGSGGVAIPLLSFNAGVELGQIVVAAILLPLIWKLRQRPQYVAKLAPACSVLIVLAGAWWLLERTVLQ